MLFKLRAPSIIEGKAFQTILNVIRRNLLCIRHFSLNKNRCSCSSPTFKACKQSVEDIYKILVGGLMSPDIYHNFSPGISP